MSTPNQAHVKIAEICYPLLETIKTAIEKNVSLKNDVKDVVSHRIEPKSLNECQRMLDSLLNQVFEYAGRITDIIMSENQTNREAFLFSQDEMNGKFKLDKIDQNTSLRNKVPKRAMVAKIGYDECIKRLKQVSTKDRKNRIVARSAACKCFGFTGSEYHFLEVWASLREWGTRAPLKTYGILRCDTINKGYKWDELMDFAKEYYFNYHIGLCKKILGGKGLSIQDKNREHFLKADD